MSGYSTEALHVARLDQYRCGTSNLVIPKHGLVRKHGTENHSIVYIVEGSGTYVREDGKVFEFKPGTILIKQARMGFDQIHDPGVLIDKYFVLNQSFYDYIIEAIEPDDASFQIAGRVCPDTLRRFDRLINEIRFQKDALLAVSWAKVLPFIMELCIPEKELSYPYRSEMEKAILMLEDLDKQLGIPTIAKALGMSEPNFRRIFKKVFGITPVEHKVRHRLKVIRQKLENKEKSIKALAHEFGYTNAYALSAQFKKYYGCSPSKLIL